MVGFDWLIQSVRKITIAISNSFNVLFSPQTKSNLNRKKHTEVEKMHYWSALVGYMGWSKNSRSYFKRILCCSLSNVTPITNFTQIGRRTQKFKFLKFLKQKRFQKSATPKLLELERFAWYH